MIERLVLLGATGDLSGRFLFPALAALSASGHLPEGFEITGVARQDLSEEAFRRRIDERLTEYAGDVSPAARAALLRTVTYRAADVSRAADVTAVLRGRTSPVAVYLALPPRLFPAVIEAVGRAGLPDESRVVLEKPFGDDLASAISLNRMLAEAMGAAGEAAIFRVDHVLGMATLQNLVALRRNRVLAAVWDRAHIEQVEILWEETLALEGRAGYYDGTGALEDVIQNHLLQILCLVAMELPATGDVGELRARKLDVLRSARCVASCRARYGAGRLAADDGAAGTPVPAYVDEEGVDPARGTETFAQLTLELDSERWRGTPFLLRAGKALKQRRKGVVVRFRPSEELWMGIDGPSDVALRLTGGSFGARAPVDLRGEPPAADLPAYARVLVDVLTGGSTLSVGAEGAEAAWRLVTPVVAAWRENRVPLEEYPAGSDGPPSCHGGARVSGSARGVNRFDAV